MRTTENRESEKTNREFRPIDLRCKQEAVGTVVVRSYRSDPLLGELGSEADQSGLHHITPRLNDFGVPDVDIDLLCGEVGLAAHSHVTLGRGQAISDRRHIGNLAGPRCAACDSKSGK